MNEIKMLTIIARRMYSRKSTKLGKRLLTRPKTPNTPLAGIRGKLEITEDQEEPESFDPEDMNEFESDFMDVDKTHKMHEQEMRQKKERLKQQITVQKYFKEKEPRFLTFAETELIRNLHRTNSEEWTIETLSQSFPASPETIQKILRAKWSPKSVEKMMQYDNVVVENWKKFKIGKLAVDPMLSKHLMKFKDRKIIMSDRESLAKQFVEPKPEFEKPKSQLFSNIIQSYLNEKQSEERLLSQRDENQVSTEHSNVPRHSNQARNLSSVNIRSDASFAADSEKLISSGKQNLALVSQVDSEKYDLIPSNKNKKIKEDKALTFNQFMKEKLEDIYKESPEEGIALLETYRKQIEAGMSDNEVNVKETITSKAIQKFDKKDCAVSEDEDNRVVRGIVSSKENALDTYVKVWNKKADSELTYAKPIKIAKHLYKSGKTYRINDCYYDDDGEFLYRIPGVRS